MEIITLDSDRLASCAGLLPISGLRGSEAPGFQALVGQMAKRGSRELPSVNERNEFAHTPLVVGVVGELVNEPPFFARRLDVEEDQEESGVDEGKPATDEESTAIGEHDAAAVHRMPDKPIRPRVDERGMRLGIRYWREVGPKPEQACDKKGSASKREANACDDADPGKGRGPGGQACQRFRTEEDEGDQSKLTDNVPLAPRAAPPSRSNAMHQDLRFLKV